MQGACGQPVRKCAGRSESAPVSVVAFILENWPEITTPVCGIDARHRRDTSNLRCDVMVKMDWDPIARKPSSRPK